MYKCKNYINPAFVGELFTSHDPPYSLRNGEKFEQPIVNIKSFGLIEYILVWRCQNMEWIAESYQRR